MRQRPVLEVLDYALGVPPSEITSADRIYLLGRGASRNWNATPKFLRFFLTLRTAIIGSWNRIAFGPSQFTEENKSVSDISNDDGTFDWALATLGLSALFVNVAPHVTQKESLALAMRAYQRAVDSKLSERSPEEWGRIQTQFGKELLYSGELFDDHNFVEKAELILKTALRWPSSTNQKAITTGLLACSLHFSAQRQDSQERLVAAISAYKTAIGMLSLSDNQLERASLYTNLGAALEQLGIWENDDRFLREAETAFRAALLAIPKVQISSWLLDDTQETKKIQSAFMRIGIQMRLAHVLVIETDDKKREAIEVYRAALAETATIVPQSKPRAPMTDEEILRSLDHEYIGIHFPRLWDPTEADA